jgi:hypothetical protein
MNKSIIMTDKNILVAVNYFAEAFESSISGVAPDVVYIKMADLKDWNANSSLFVIKEFGDRSIGLSLRFMYKNGDKEFDAENLSSEILRFKISHPKLFI